MQKSLNNSSSQNHWEAGVVAGFFNGFFYATNRLSLGAVYHPKIHLMGPSKK